MSYYLGIDFGTSGTRAIAIDSQKMIKSEVKSSFSLVNHQDLPLMWKNALFNLFTQISPEIKKELKAICINGTSSTVLLGDRSGNPITSPFMYNDSMPTEVMTKLQAIAPPKHTVLNLTSSLAKLLFWLNKEPKLNQYYTDFITPLLWEKGAGGEGYFFLHQADWLAYLLHGKIGITDYHNALKLGYDVEKLCYPQWLTNLPLIDLLPQVIKPGEIIGEILPEIAENLGINKQCVICAGTTDSIAAFIASGANLPGEAVTSLGSTLVIKLLSKTRIDNADYGIYSHKFGDLWLVGGASNTGGAILKHFFDDQTLINLSKKIIIETPTNLEYYPLLKPGERFPINDPDLEPKLTPRPQDDVKFLQGLLESIAKIETLGYKLLQELGSTKLTKIYTAGGGAKNQVWSKIRETYLQVPIFTSTYTEAAYGSALLSYNSFVK